MPGLGEMEGSPPRHGAWVRDAELQEDPLTRFLLRWDEFEVGTRALSDRNGTQIMMGKDKGPLGSGKGRELNAEVARICLALHRARPFTHLAATDGGRDMPNKWVWGIGSCLDQLCRMGCTKGRPDSGDPSRDLDSSRAGTMSCGSRLGRGCGAADCQTTGR